MTVLMMVLLSAIAQNMSADNVLRVDTSTIVTRVNPGLWGMFFEEINHSGDGGLYAEMVRNRSFEDNRVPEGCVIEGDFFKSPTGWKLPCREQAVHMTGWTPASPDAQATLELEAQEPMNSASPTYARFHVKSLDAKGRAGFANGGFWGMSLVKDGEYRLSLYCRAGEGYSSPIMAALESSDGGKVYCETELPAPGMAWTKVSATFKSRDTDHSARLALYATGVGTVYFDMVSLMPVQTYKGRENGLRPDLAVMLAELKPGFIRFPGGCIVEGFTPESAWNWKETIGDIAMRSGRQNLWGYRASDGFGYHEMLQFAEDIGAEPIVVVNCGITCQGRGPVFQPLEDMEPYVQDALDAIEYANGDEETTWGKERIKNGHPEPFNMKYITIGNENSGPEYAARYRLFAEAIREKYPDIKLIANDRMGDAAVDMEEHHYYMTPGWFASHGKRYDQYDRALPKVFVSEYAANQACGVGNLEAAIGESIFMIGLENNSDVVDMAAYAPLLCHEENREWPVNLIVFDNHRVYGTPSYYAQKLFAENRPDILFESQVPIAADKAALDHGRVGLGTWNTQAEFKDIEVRQGENVLYKWNPDEELKGWEPKQGAWKVQDGAIRQEDSGMNCTIQVGDTSWTDYTFKLKARKIRGSEGFLILFRAKDPDNLLWLNLGGWGNSAHGVEGFLEGAHAGDYPRKPGFIEENRWYDIEITVTGDRYRITLDGEKLFEAPIQKVETAGIQANAGRIEKTGEYVVKVANYLEESRELKMVLEGVKGPVSGKATVLHSPRRADENSLENPRNVVPVEKTFQAESNTFDYEFPPCSLTVFRVSEKK